MASRKRISCLQPPKKAALVLEDGSYFEGYAMGAKATALGEFVFHTAHSGYQEIVTDPSYHQQVMVFSSAHIGNQGFHSQDYESDRVWVRACVMRNYHDPKEHWRKELSFDQFLKQHNTPGIYGVDTRRLILKLRDQGCLWGVVSTETISKAKLVKMLEAKPSMQGLSLTGDVSCSKKSVWETELTALEAGRLKSFAGNRGRCVVYDLGVKYQILRYLKSIGFNEVIRMPAHSTAEELLALQPDLILLSNGPGDPAAETFVIEQVKNLMGKRPLFGICLGHQILALALGLNTTKLKFGHHAANHPVKNLKTGQVEITSQNHGFAVESIEADHPDIELTHRHLNDQSVSGFRHKKLPVAGVQYHPESSPGPIDSLYLFEELQGAQA